MFLLSSWLASLSVFSRLEAPSFLSRVFHSYMQGLYVLIRYFWWLIVADMAWTVWLKDIAATIKASSNTSTPQNVTTAFVFVVLIASVLWFFTNALLLLGIKAPSKEYNDHYYKKGLLYYTHISILFSFCMLLGLLICARWGIIKYPGLHWSLAGMVKGITVLITVYWLDSENYFIDLFKSIEKGLNLFLYNLPFFAVVILMIAGLSKGFLVLLTSLQVIPASYETLLSGSELFGSHAQREAVVTNITGWQLVLVKYLKFMVDGMAITCVVCFYQIRKQIRYCDSLFE